MAELVVHLNRGELYDVEPAVGSFEAAGPFAVELHNHGQPVHVHLRLDEALSTVASTTGQNHYVEGESGVRLPVEVDPDAPPTEGTLTVVTGYGDGRAEVPVAVEGAGDADESATRADATAAAEDREADTGGPTGLRDWLPAGTRFQSFGDAPLVVAAVALAVVALAAAGAAATLGSGLGVVAAIFVGLAAVATAAYATVR